MPVLDILRRYPFAIRILAGTLADGLLALFCYRLDLNLATTSLLFLLAVVGQSLRGGARSSTLASFIAAGFLDYFFVPPILTLRISDPFDFIALLVFVSTSLVITSLASRARREAHTAERRRTSLERLYRASQALISMPADADVIETLVKTLQKTFNLRAVCLFDGDEAELYLEGESEQLVECTRNAYLSGSDADDSKTGISTRCLRRAGRVAFALGFDGLRDPELTAGPLVTLAIATVERARASQAASRAVAETKAEAFRAAVLDGLAHEFKTPLAIIVTAAGGIREAGPLGVEQVELADAIEEEASRLSDLTTRLLRKAEVDADQIKPRLREGNLMDLASRLVQTYANQLVGRRIRVKQEGARADAMIDEELLRLALTQLLDNAVKYSRPDSSILVTVCQAGKRLDVRVTNTGSSIAPAECQRIFDRFHRGTGGRDNASGTGLGLYVARKIARAHGGALELDPKSDAGTVTFRLSLPLPERENRHVCAADQSVSCR